MADSFVVYGQASVASVPDVEDVDLSRLEFGEAPLHESDSSGVVSVIVRVLVDYRDSALLCHGSCTLSVAE